MSFWAAVFPQRNKVLLEGQDIGRHKYKLKIYSAPLKKNEQQCVSSQAVTLSGANCLKYTVLLGGSFFLNKTCLRAHISYYTNSIVSLDA